MGRTRQPGDDPVIRIPLLQPRVGYVRSGEGDFIRLTDGRIMFIYSRFQESASDFAPSDLAARFSTDQGSTWTDHDVQVLPNEGRMNTMSASLLRLPDHRIALFYLRKNGLDDCRLHLRFSGDEARTWSEPTLCIAEPGYYIVNNDRVVQLSSGRLVAPAASPPNRRFRFTPGQGDIIEPAREEAMCFLSDDAGRSWRRSRSLVRPPFDDAWGLEEPAVVERTDGRLWMLCRTHVGRHYQSFSGDGGDTWEPATPTELLSPCSPCSIERLPTTGHLLLVWNDHRQVDDAHRGKRSPLNAAISRDEGASWENLRTIGDVPDHEYSYTAIDFCGDRVLLAHNVPGSIQQITVFPVSWLY